MFLLQFQMSFCNDIFFSSILHVNIFNFFLKHFKISFIPAIKMNTYIHPQPKTLNLWFCTCLCLWPKSVSWKLKCYIFKIIHFGENKVLGNIRNCTWQWLFPRGLLIILFLVPKYFIISDILTITLDHCFKFKRVQYLSALHLIHSPKYNSGIYPTRFIDCSCCRS